MPKFAIYSMTRSLQSTGKRIFPYGTHEHTLTTDGHQHLETELAQRADSVKCQYAIKFRFEQKILSNVLKLLSKYNFFEKFYIIC